jgi:hypothetical protein
VDPTFSGDERDPVVWGLPGQPFRRRARDQTCKDGIERVVALDALIMGC